MGLLTSDWVRTLIDLAQFLGIVLLWLRKPGQDAGERVAKVEAKVQVIEESLKHVPTSTELAELEGSVKAISAGMAALTAETSVIRSSVARIEDFLRENR